MAALLKDNKITFAYHLLNKAFGAYKPQVALMTALGFLSGLLEGVGINAVIPLFSLVSDTTPPGADAISNIIRTAFVRAHIAFTFTSLAILIALLFIAKAFVLFAANYLNARMSYSYEMKMRTELFRESLDASWPHLLNQKIGHLEKVLVDHVSASSGVLLLLSSSVLILTNLIMYLLVAVNISAPITIVTLIVGAALFLIIKPLLYRTRKVSYRLSEMGKAVSHHINEHMIGIKTVKAINAETSVLIRGEHLFEHLRRARLQLSLYNSGLNVFIQPVSIVFILAVFAFSYQSPQFNFASFAVILYLIQKIFSYVQSMQGKLNGMSESAPYLKSVTDHRESMRQNREHDEGTQPFSFQSLLAIRDVQFHYHRETDAVLKNVRFEVKKGSMVGIIGPSGSGKTTVVDLILRLLTPLHGAITLDGIDIHSIRLADWRRHVGYVSQDIFLLNDTIEHNITFYHDLTRAEVMAAARLAYIHDFIDKLPEGYGTVVGERGMELSAGQRQRIILARVLARQPDILILDEATSALDNESEALIQRTIEHLKGRVTIIIIAHRLTTLKHCDSLIILQDGIIKERGRPDALLKDKDSYFYKVNTVHF
ncbi:MAG: ABC transporter ATP-binding protein [Patescibacteria group bacterium]